MKQKVKINRVVVVLGSCTIKVAAAVAIKTMKQTRARAHTHSATTTTTTKLSCNRTQKKITDRLVYKVKCYQRKRQN